MDREVRTRLLRIATTVAVLLTLPLAAGAGPEDPWTFEGGGWGHGIGLSQFGSQGMAEDGHTAEEIIARYYSGAQVKTLTDIGAESWLFDPEAIWVGLARDKSTQTFQAIGGPIDVCLLGDGSDTCETPDLTLSNTEILTMSVKEGSEPLRCEAGVDGGVPIEGDCWLDLTWVETVPSIRVLTGGLQYTRGSIHIRPNHSVSPDAFHVSVSLDLEKYIYGIAETLLRWHPETLKTQAIIARSYGAAKALTSADGSGELWQPRKDLCWCHIGSTSLDQNYDGWSGGLATEGHPTLGQKWRDAADDTAAKIVTHPAHGGGTSIISTFYSSSNGGWSENNEDVWGGTPRPWLRSVEDPWSADPTINPLARWTVLVTNADMATALGWDQVHDAQTLTGPPGVIVRFSGKKAGIPVTDDLNGNAIRFILNTYGYKADGSRVRVSPYIISATGPLVPFNDIQGNVFEDAIGWLYEEGITVGCNPPTNDLFCPNGKVTRGEMAVFISRAMGLPAPSGDYFTDDDGRFWEGGANRMFEAGISVGCGGNNFCGDQHLPREQMAVFLVRALELPPTGTDYFTDDENSPFQDHINRIAEAQITLGCNPPTNDHFCPNDTVTRGQMAAFFKRAWGP